MKVWEIVGETLCDIYRVSKSGPFLSATLFFLNSFGFLTKSTIIYLEDRCVRVLVDSDNSLGVLHAGEMLDRAADAHGYV